MVASDNKFLSGVLQSDAVEQPVPSLGEIGLNNFVPYLMNRIAARWNGDLAEQMRPFNLTTPQMRVLAVLSINSGLTVNELSVLTVTEQSTMSRTLDILEDREFVRRRARTQDMRVREIEVTGSGRAAFGAFWPVMFGHYQSMFAGIDEKEFSDLVAILHKVLRNIRRGDSDQV